MKKIFKVIPAYSFIPVVALTLAHLISYYASKLINQNFKMHDFTTAFDRLVPFVSPFIVIYVVCFIYWAVSFFYAAYAEKEQFYTFITAGIICYAICFVVYLVLPTTIARPEIENTNIFNWMVIFIYDADTPTNLMPSIHCLVSWLCWRSIAGQANIPKKIQHASLVFAILVCISTQVLKQHYIVDLISAILIAEVVFWATKRFKWYAKPQQWFQTINQKFNLE